MGLAVERRSREICRIFWNSLRCFDANAGCHLGSVPSTWTRNGTSRHAGKQWNYNGSGETGSFRAREQARTMWRLEQSPRRSRACPFLKSRERLCLFGSRRATMKGWETLLIRNRKTLVR